MDHPQKEVHGEIINRHAAGLRGLALAERSHRDHTTLDDIFAPVNPAADHD